MDTRPVLPEDQPFLYELYASTRSEELAQFGWPPAQQEAFVKLQFYAQSRSYESQFADSDHRIIRDDSGRPIGRIMVDRSGTAIHLVDIALLPGARGAGIGTALLKQLQAEAHAAGLPVRLSVVATNRAQRLYERLGFTVTEQKAPYLAMQWLPASGGTPPCN